MPTKSPSKILDICRELESTLKELRDNDPAGKWFNDPFVKEILSDLEAATKWPPVSVIELKPRENPSISENKIQEFQKKLDESIGITSLKLLLLRDWNGALTKAIPIFVLFRPSVYPDFLNGKIESGFEYAMMRGPEIHVGRNNAILHIGRLLRKNEAVNAFTIPESDDGEENTAPSTVTEVDEVKQNPRITQAATSGAIKKKLDRRERAFQEFKLSVGPILVKLKKIEADKVDSISRHEFMRLADTIESNEIKNVLLRMANIQRKHENGTIVSLRNGNPVLEFGSIPTLKRDMCDWRKNQTDGLNSKPTV
jgi:hypothetical protein